MWCHMQGDEERYRPRSRSSSGMVQRGGAGRGRSIGAKGKVTCQADGCMRDLTVLTYYHQRNRICDNHIKVRGLVQQPALHRLRHRSTNTKFFCDHRCQLGVRRGT